MLGLLACFWPCERSVYHWGIRSRGILELLGYWADSLSSYIRARSFPFGGLREFEEAVAGEGTVGWGTAFLGALGGGWGSRAGNECLTADESRIMPYVIP